MSDDQIYTIAGYTTCGFYKRAIKCGEDLVAEYNSVRLNTLSTTKDEFRAYMENKHVNLNHMTSPAVWKGTPEDGEFIGGADDFEAHVKREYPSEG